MKAMTYQLIYSSVSSTPMQLEELEDLLEQAQGNNAIHGITGALVYADGFFMQILEGERASVERLMERISRDLRHETLLILQEGEIPSGSFSDWNMAYISATPEQIAAWAGLSVTTQLPDVWRNIREDPERVTQVARSILGALVGGSPA